MLILTRTFPQAQIILLPLLGIRKCVIGSLQRLESIFGILPPIVIRMILHSELAVRPLDLISRGRVADAKDVIVVLRRGDHGISIRTNFTRPDAPLLIDTADFPQSKCFATSLSSSSLAFPSTGDDLTWAIHVPSSPCSSRLARELGFTFI